MPEFPHHIDVERNVLDATETEFDRISPTALVIAHLRSYMRHTPYVEEIARRSNAAQEFNSLPLSQYPHDFTILMQGRYQTLSYLVEQYNNRNIVEVASGISARGLTLTEKRTDYTYVETDLPRSIKTKQALVSDILQNTERSNLHFSPLDITNGQQLDAAITLLGKGSTTLVSEGVFAYLNREAIAEAARNIHRILSDRGGVWLTDMVTQEVVNRSRTALDDGSRELVDALSVLSTVELSQTALKDESDARSFFDALGFKITPYSRNEGPVLETLGLPDGEPNLERAQQILAPKSIWALEIK